MGFLDLFRRKVTVQPEQKWDFISLNDFKSTSIFTPLAYAYLWVSICISCAVYVVDIFTMVQLLAFKQQWSSQVQSASIIPPDVSKWIFTICIILSAVNLIYEHIRANRAMRTGSVAESFLDHLAAKLESLRIFGGKGWKRFLVFAALTESKKGVEYIALFCYFNFQSWIRVLLCSGPRQVVNAFSLYSFFTSELRIDGQDFGDSVMDFFRKIEAFAENDYRQAATLSGMCFTLVIWIFSFLSLLLSAVFFVCFLWCYIPRADGGLTGFCERKVNKRLKQIVSAKINAAMAEEEEKRKKAQMKAAKKKGEDRPMTMKATLPNVGASIESRTEKLPEMPSLSRQDTMATLPACTSRPSTPGGYELGSIEKRPMPPSRAGTFATQFSGTSSTSLIGAAAEPARQRANDVPTVPKIDMNNIPPTRTATMLSKNSYGFASQSNFEPRPLARAATGLSNYDTGSPQSDFQPRSLARTATGLSNVSSAPSQQPSFQPRPLTRAATGMSNIGPGPQPQLQPNQPRPLTRAATGLSNPSAGSQSQANYQPPRAGTVPPQNNFGPGMQQPPPPRVGTVPPRNDFGPAMQQPNSSFGRDYTASPAPYSNQPVFQPPARAPTAPPMSYPNNNYRGVEPTPIGHTYTGNLGNQNQHDNFSSGSQVSQTNNPYGGLGDHMSNGYDRDGYGGGYGQDIYGQDSYGQPGYGYDATGHDNYGHDSYGYPTQNNSQMPPRLGSAPPPQTQPGYQPYIPQRNMTAPPEGQPQYRHQQNPSKSSLTSVAELPAELPVKTPSEQHPSARAGSVTSDYLEYMMDGSPSSRKTDAAPKPRNGSVSSQGSAAANQEAKSSGAHSRQGSADSVSRAVDSGTKSRSSSRKGSIASSVGSSDPHQRQDSVGSVASTASRRDLEDNSTTAAHARQASSDRVAPTQTPASREDYFANNTLIRQASNAAAPSRDYLGSSNDNDARPGSSQSRATSQQQDDDEDDYFGINRALSQRQQRGGASSDREVDNSDVEDYFGPTTFGNTFMRTNTAPIALDSNNNNDNYDGVRPIARTATAPPFLQQVQQQQQPQQRQQQQQYMLQHREQDEEDYFSQPSYQSSYQPSYNNYNNNVNNYNNTTNNAINNNAGRNNNNNNGWNEDIERGDNLMRQMPRGNGGNGGNGGYGGQGQYGGQGGQGGGGGGDYDYDGSGYGGGSRW
ncbi:hypothetical protein SMACR_06346 [Sordaria macrospora]|uniref:WGS project CABT00000000 data, contig 2.34 n=2 Tax=Sordaria macrospora TaxID=5147 RepID=F7W6I9_SORMK|nr:uncharacterized protein SMAC_06346 [Sordaria macrospora k-hell]KAA8635168.1 hypothetical protein SMACR_06346 [Sordaria macrospora]WPJ67048.1 hypothetical protein SMAC4_06346 [Sordaria macrospora]CCC13128.1 unnamed protein product [Sordaria macrospora k-hell]